MTSIGFSFRFEAVGADAGKAGIGGVRDLGVSPRTDPSRVRQFAQTLGGFLATHVEREFLDEAERQFAEDLERLRLLLEASSTLLGSLDVDAMLPQVLDLASRTLAADAYALASLAVDLGIGEAVDIVNLVYAKIPKRIFKRNPDFWYHVEGD